MSQTEGDLGSLRRCTAALRSAPDLRTGLDLPPRCLSSHTPPLLSAPHHRSPWNRAATFQSAKSTLDKAAHCTDAAHLGRRSHTANRSTQPRRQSRRGLGQGHPKRSQSGADRTSHDSCRTLAVFHHHTLCCTGRQTGAPTAPCLCSHHHRQAPGSCSIRQACRRRIQIAPCPADPSRRTPHLRPHCSGSCKEGMHQGTGCSREHLGTAGTGQCCRKFGTLADADPRSLTRQRVRDPGLGMSRRELPYHRRSWRCTCHRQQRPRNTM